MAESHVLSALRQKRAEVAGTITVTERRLGDLRASLVHLDATLRLFALDINPEAIIAKLPRPDAAPRLARGSLTRAVLEVLRDAEVPKTTNEVADRVAVTLNVSANDRVGRTTLRDRVEGTLFRQRDRRMVVSVKDGPRNLWQVAA